MADQTISQPDHIKYPHWQREFEDALLEAEPQTLRQRVDVAEAVLFLRSQALAGSAQDQAEQQAISDAIRILREIQEKKLGYPPLNKR
jgi:hypothetical protein